MSSGGDQRQPGGRAALIGLRSWGQDTRGCACQFPALSSGIKQAYGVEARVPDMTSPENLREAHMTATRLLIRKDLIR